MSPGDTHRLLTTTADPPEFFLVRRGAELPPGALQLRTLTGQVRGFQAEALAPYRVDERTAQEHTQAVVSTIQASMPAWTNKLRRLLNTLRSVPAQLSSPAPQGTNEPGAEATKTIAKLLDRGLEELTETAQAALFGAGPERTAARAKIDALVDAMGDDPEGAAALKEVLASMREGLLEALTDPDLPRRVEQLSKELTGPPLIALSGLPESAALHQLRVLLAKRGRLSAAQFQRPPVDPRPTLAPLVLKLNNALEELPIDDGNKPRRRALLKQRQLLKDRIEADLEHRRQFATLHEALELAAEQGPAQHPLGASAPLGPRVSSALSTLLNESLDRVLVYEAACTRGDRERFWDLKDTLDALHTTIPVVGTAPIQEGWPTLCHTLEALLAVHHDLSCAPDPR